MGKRTNWWDNQISIYWIQPEIDTGKADVSARLPYKLENGNLSWSVDIISENILGESQNRVYQIFLSILQDAK